MLGSVNLEVSSSSIQMNLIQGDTREIIVESISLISRQKLSFVPCSLTIFWDMSFILSADNNFIDWINVGNSTPIFLIMFISNVSNIESLIFNIAFLGCSSPIFS